MSTLLVNNIKSYTGDTVTVGDSIGTDTVKIRAELGVSGSLTVSGSVFPLANNKYDLGRNNGEWKDLYVNGTANIDALAGVETANIVSASVQHIDGPGGNLKVSGSLIPNDNDAFNLGSANSQWKDLHVNGTANIDAHNLPGAAASAEVGGLFTLSGSQIFSSSAFPGGANQIFLSGDFSSSLFVFQKA